VKIRRAKRKDFESVAGLLQGERSPSEPSYRWYVKVLKDLNHDLHVMEDEGTVLGFASVGYFKSVQDGGRRAVIECLRCAFGASRAVKEELIRHAVERARKKNCTAIGAPPLSVDRDILGAFGFQEGIPSLWMVLPRIGP
jgi:hypothetical protein